MDPDIVLADAWRSPLNSKQLAATNLLFIADACSLPKSTDELRQLVYLHHESQKVQVAPEQMDEL